MPRVPEDIDPSQYDVEIIDWHVAAHTSPVDHGTNAMRFMVCVTMVPWKRLFQCHIYTDLTPRERTMVQRWCVAMPQDWDEFPDQWRPIVGESGNTNYRQFLGTSQKPFDFVELELQMMLPSDVDTAVGMPQMPVV